MLPGCQNASGRRQVQNRKGALDQLWVSLLFCFSGVFTQNKYLHVYFGGTSRPSCDEFETCNWQLLFFPFVYLIAGVLFSRCSFVQVLKGRPDSRKKLHRLPRIRAAPQLDTCLRFLAQRYVMDAEALPDKAGFETPQIF